MLRFKKMIISGTIWMSNYDLTYITNPIIMKNVIIILLLVSISLFSYSQELNDQHFSPKAEGWLLDSTFHTCMDYRDQVMFRVLERNKYDFPLKEELVDFNFSTNEYETFYERFYHYPIEFDSNVFFETVVYNDNDSVRYFNNNDDNGYLIESNEFWSKGVTWRNGRMEKRNINYILPCYHYLDYTKKSETGGWILEEENKAIFNNDSTILFEFSYDRIDSIMDTTRKYFTYYNENHLQDRYEYFRKTDGEWKLRNYNETTYDENNRVISIIKSKNYNDELIFDDKRIYEYDENGFLSSEQWYNWNRELGFWKFYKRDDFINDSLGNVITEIEFRDISDTAWIVRRKRENIYNEENKRIQSEKFYFHSDSIWKELSIVFYTHHSDQYYSYENLTWDTALNQYKNNHKMDLILDENERLIENRLFDLNPIDYSWRHKYTYSFPYIETDDQFIKKEIHYFHITEDTTELNIYYYNNRNTGLYEINPNSYSLFPNPSTDVIYIQSEIFNSQNLKYEIFNMNGQLIKNGIANTRGDINVQQLTQGLYLLKVYKPDNKTEVLKFQKLSTK